MMKIFTKQIFYPLFIASLFPFSNCFALPPWQTWDGKDCDKIIPQLDSYMLSAESIYDDKKELNWATKIFTIIGFETNTPGFNKTVNINLPPKFSEMAQSELEVNTNFDLNENIRQTCVQKTKTVHQSTKNPLPNRAFLAEFSLANLEKNCPSLHSSCSDKTKGNAWMHYHTFSLCASNWRVPLRMDRYCELHHSTMTNRNRLAFMQCNSVGMLPLFCLIPSNRQVDRLLEIIVEDPGHLFRFYKLRNACIDPEMQNETTVSFSIIPLIMAICKFKQKATLTEAFLLILKNSQHASIIHTASTFYLLLCLLDNTETQRELYKLKDLLPSEAEKKWQSVSKTREVSAYAPYLDELKANLALEVKNSELFCTHLLYAMMYQTQLKNILWGRRATSEPELESHAKAILSMLKKINKLRENDTSFSSEKILYLHAAIFEYPEIAIELSQYLRDQASLPVVMSYLTSMTSPLDKDEGEDKKMRAFNIGWKYPVATLMCQMRKELTHQQAKPVENSQSSSWGSWFRGSSQTTSVQPKQKTVKKAASPEAINHLDAFLHTKDLQNSLGIATDDIIKLSQYIVETIPNFPKESSDYTIAKWLYGYAQQCQPHTF